VEARHEHRRESAEDGRPAPRREPSSRLLTHFRPYSRNGGRAQEEQTIAEPQLENFDQEIV
jgi:hypothetical protein